jgi:hypothetical protein
VKIVFVTKDRGTMPMATALRRILISRGHEIVVMAREGLSSGMWQEEGVEPQDSMDVASDVDCFVTGLGSPIGELERDISSTYQGQVPVVWIADVGGAETRMPDRLHPNMLLACDPVAPVSPHIESRAKVVRTGSQYLYANLGKDLGPVQTVRETVDGKVFLLAGQAEWTTDVIRWLAESLKLSGNKFKVVVRLHPKFKQQTELWAEWTRLANEDLGPWVTDAFDDITGSGANDKIAQVVDGTVSVFSTILLVAATTNTIPISVLTNATQAGMVEETGFNHLPLCTVGGAFECTEPIDLRTLALTDSMRATQLQLKPMIAPETIAADAIESLLRWRH